MSGQFWKRVFVLCAMLSMVLPVRAADVNSLFDVNINLTSACKIESVAPVAFDYTSFQSSVASSTGGGFTVRCTKDLPYAISFADTAGTTTMTVSDNAVDLTYGLALGMNAATGTGVNQNFSITGTMAANQAGTCTGATCDNTSATNKNHTLYVVW